MKRYRCYFCEILSEKVSQHHINGKGTAFEIEDQDNRPINFINLCTDCHDRVEAVCSKCADQGKCNNIKFKECWIFEEAIPPKYFRSFKQAIKDMFLSNEVREAKCPKCNSTNIARISIWRCTGIGAGKSAFKGIYNCKKCNNKFQRKLESSLERSNDNKQVSIEIENFHSYEDVLLEELGEVLNG